MKTLFKFGALVAVCPLAPSYAADWSDTEVQLLHGSKFKEPGIDREVVKSILTLSHASGHKFGRNYFFVDIIRSSGADNNAGEVYSEYYTTVSIPKLGGMDWSKSIVKDLGITAGINFGSKSNANSANARRLLLGPTIDFNAPGFKLLSVDFLAYRDSTTSATGNPCGADKTTYQLTPTWNVPFTLGSAKFSFEGYIDYIGRHGTCARQAQAQPQLRWDVGNHVGQPDTVFLGIEYQYWRNKFGNSSVQERFPQLLLAWKL